MSEHCQFCKEPIGCRWLGRYLCIDHWFEVCEIGKIAFLRKYDKKFNERYEREIMPRELREFVEDQLSDGKRPFQILAVASASCWKGQKTEILAILKSFSGKLKKRYIKRSKNQ